MREALLTFLGYLFVTIGIYVLYLIIFRRSRLPEIFSKLWFIILILLVSIAITVIGWIIVV